MHEITQSLDFFALQNPNKVFLYDLKKQRGFSYKEVNSLVNSICHYYKTLGLKKGDIVALYLENCVEFCLLFFASVRYGTILFPYPYLFIPVELSKDLGEVRSKVLFIQDEKKKDFLKRPDCPWISVVVDKEGGFLEEMRRYDTAFLEAGVSPEDYACLYPSSGASNHPRGIYYTHKNIQSLIPSLCRGFKHTGRDTHLIVLPLAHSAAINYSLFPALYCGGSVVLADSFWNIREDFWGICQDHDVSYVETVPAILFMLLNLPAKFVKTTHLKYVACGSAPLPLNLQIEFEKRFGLPVANLYGLTETGPTHVDYPLSPDWKRGAIGRALDINRVEIMDENGKKLPPGKEGEIAVKGDNVFPGYAIHPELTKQHFKKGYFCTGDIGYREGSGVFYFCRRKKELIIRGGLNIHPGEINEVLLTHPGVKAVSTRGVPDDFFGEQIKSFIVLRENTRLGEKELKNFCKNRLSPIKIPDFIHFVGELPKSL